MVVTVSFHIYAWLESGNPRLQVIEAQSGAIHFSWQYQEDKGSGHKPKDKKEIQRLFQNLLLLTCKQEIKNCRLFKTEPNQSHDSIHQT